MQFMIKQRSCFAAAAAIVSAGLLAVASPTGASAQDQTFDYKGDDPVMNKAMETARDNLPRFFDEIRSPEVAGIMLKVAVDATDIGHTLEHIWMTDCRRGAKKAFACIVANDPHTSNVKQGQAYEFNMAEVTDWAYFDGQGKMHGAYTIRVILPQLPEDQAAEYRAILAPLPE